MYDVAVVQKISLAFGLLAIKIIEIRCVKILTDVVRVYTGFPGRKGHNFGRVFLMLKYTDTAQNPYIQS
jgi:hypothetical protein